MQKRNINNLSTKTVNSYSEEWKRIEKTKEKPQKGKIIAVGNGTKENKITVKVGDQVLYGKYSGTELNINGVDYLIMKESDIFGTI